MSSLLNLNGGAFLSIKHIDVIAEQTAESCDEVAASPDFEHTLYQQVTDYCKPPYRGCEVALPDAVCHWEDECSYKR